MNKINASIQQVKAFAPATCANVAVGFDILGFALESPGDSVTLTKRDDRQIIIESIDSQEALPFATGVNTASAVIQKLCHHLNLDIGFSIHIEKGIPLSSGLGGSAASAVAALVACNAFLTSPLPIEELARFALFGEEIASGDAHPDNIIPCLFGGLTLIQSQNPVKVIALPVPEIYCVVIHPHLQVATREARETLAKNISLTAHVQHSANLACFITALYENDHQLLQQSLQDILIEPQRAKFVPEFYKIKEAALQAGALGMSFSGSGPSMFAFAKTPGEAKKIADAMRLPLHKINIQADYWISPIGKKAAHIL